MLTLDEVRKGLEDRNLTEVARRTELTYNQVYGVATGKTKHAPYEVVKALSDYLEGKLVLILPEGWE